MKLKASVRLKAGQDTVEADIAKIQQAFKGLIVGQPVIKDEGPVKAFLFRMKAGSMSYRNYGDSYVIGMDLPGFGYNMGEGKTFSQALFDLVKDLGKEKDAKQKKIKALDEELRGLTDEVTYLDKINEAAIKAGR